LYSQETDHCQIFTLYFVISLTNKRYDKRDDFNFPIVNYPFFESNIPSSPAYGVYMSQLIRYSREPVILFMTFYIDLSC